MHFAENTMDLHNPNQKICISILITIGYAAVSLTFCDELGFPNSAGFCATQDLIIAYGTYQQLLRRYNAEKEE